MTQQLQTPAAVSTPEVPSPAGAPLTPATQAWREAVRATLGRASVHHRSVAQHQIQKRGGMP